MQVCIRSLVRCVRPTLHYAHKLQSTLAAAAPESGQQASLDPSVAALADQICQLNLLQTSQLTALLKDKLGIGELSFGAPAAAAPAAVTEEVVEEVKEEQVAFHVKIAGYDTASKVKLIKAVKGVMEGINLVQAKKLVETIPCVLMENVSKEEAEKIKAALVEAGGEVELV